MGKLFFFEADGTILDIKKGVTPDVPQAIRRLTEKGHMAFLCTGRSRAFVPREVDKLGFTGMITNLSAYIEYQGKAVYDKGISLADAKLALDTLRKYGLVPVMEGNAHMYYDQGGE
jgi:hydroxymethylpyrimidine pyrophosphatase-like HAD family hydrolase